MPLDTCRDKHRQCEIGISSYETRLKPGRFDVQQHASEERE